MDRGVPAIFATDSGKPLAERIMREFNLFASRNRKTADASAAAVQTIETRRLDMILADPLTLGASDVVHFGEGELRVDLHESVREKDVFLIQSPYEPPLTDEKKALVPYRLLANVQEGIIFAHALKGRGASSTVLVTPYMPFARQDHTRKRESLTAATYGKQLHAAGLRAIITVEVHSQQHGLIYEGLDMGFENLRTGPLFIDELAKEYGVILLHTEEQGKCIRRPKERPNLVIISPDSGGLSRARFYAKHFDAEVASGDKRRDYSKVSVVEDIRIVGDVKGKEKVVVDDMVASGGSMCAVVEKLYDQDGIPLTLVATHPLLTGQATERFDKLFEEGKLRLFMTMDTVMRPSSFKEQHPWYREISCAPMIARTIYQMNMSLPVSDVHEEPC